MFWGTEKPVFLVLLVNVNSIDFLCVRLCIYPCSRKDNVGIAYSVCSMYSCMLCIYTVHTRK